jgi:DNA-binding transcriptional ArsR family regulator
MKEDLRREIYQLHAGVCMALSDPKRIAMLYELRGGPKNVSELAASLNLGQVTVSRHLKVLREHFLVDGEREGTAVRYSLADPRVVQALDLLREVLAFTLARRKALAEAAEAMERHAAPG